MDESRLIWFADSLLLGTHESTLDAGDFASNTSLSRVQFQTKVSLRRPVVAAVGGI
jgi:hypothetical protein